MASKIDVSRAKIIRAELSKVRCWITGFSAGRNGPGTVSLAAVIPGTDSLRQAQLFLDEIIADAEKKSR